MSIEECEIHFRREGVGHSRLWDSFLMSFFTALMRKTAMRSILRFRTLAVGVLLVVAGLFSAARGSWIGSGEVIGEVLSSELHRGPQESVVFHLAISKQTIDGGPRLASPQYFQYGGQLRRQVSPGDSLKLKVRSSTSEGIWVDYLEFLVDEPGEPKPAKEDWTLVAVLIGIVVLGSGGCWLVARQILRMVRRPD